MWDTRIGIPSNDLLKKHYKNGGYWLRCDDYPKKGNNCKYPCQIRPKDINFEICWVWDDCAWYPLRRLYWDNRPVIPISKDFEFVTWESVEKLPD